MIRRLATPCRRLLWCSHGGIKGLETDHRLAGCFRNGGVGSLTGLLQVLPAAHALVCWLTSRVARRGRPVGASYGADLMVHGQMKWLRPSGKIDLRGLQEAGGLIYTGMFQEALRDHCRAAGWSLCSSPCLAESRLRGCNGGCCCTGSGGDGSCYRGIHLQTSRANR